jgi:hypothetical protein
MRCVLGPVCPDQSVSHAPVPHPPSNIEVFSSGPPTREHVDVGVIQVLGMGWDDYLHQLRDEASRRGCDAVVLGHGFATCAVYRDGVPRGDDPFQKNPRAKPSVETNLGGDPLGPPDAFPAER